MKSGWDTLYFTAHSHLKMGILLTKNSHFCPTLSGDWGFASLSLRQHHNKKKKKNQGKANVPRMRKPPKHFWLLSVTKAASCVTSSPNGSAHSHPLTAQTGLQQLLLKAKYFKHFFLLSQESVLSNTKTREQDADVCTTHTAVRCFIRIRTFAVGSGIQQWFVLKEDPKIIFLGTEFVMGKGGIIQRPLTAQYLIVHVVEVQGLPKGCFHFLLHVFVAHGTDKRDNPGRKENHWLSSEIYLITETNQMAEPLNPHLNGLLSSSSR